MRVRWWDRFVAGLYRLHIPSHWRDVFRLKGWWDSGE